MEDNGWFLGLSLTDAEHDALIELSKMKELSHEAIMRQALRLYQLVALGHATIIPIERMNLAYEPTEQS